VFDNDVLILGRHPPQWLADAFLQPLDISFADLQRAVSTSLPDPLEDDELAKAFGLTPVRNGGYPMRIPGSEHQLRDMQHTIIKALTLKSRTLWMNPCRRRRNLMKLLPELLQLETGLAHTAAQIASQKVSFDQFFNRNC
jgi:hypothetical protein